jgi:hypothetical protein
MDEICVCGHVADEHSGTGECQACDCPCFEVDD